MTVLWRFESACKPDSVLGDHLSRPAHYCEALAAYLRISGPPRLRVLALLPVGFAEPPHHCDAGALLPHHFTVTLLKAVSFCCTFR